LRARPVRRTNAAVSDEDINEQERFARTILEKVGPTEALLMAMRLVLLVGQRKPEDPEVITSARDAINSIKRLGQLTGTLITPGDAQ
jgi:hypothetical protein